MDNHALYLEPRAKLMQSAGSLELWEGSTKCRKKMTLLIHRLNALKTTF